MFEHVRGWKNVTRQLLRRNAVVKLIACCFLIGGLSACGGGGGGGGDNTATTTEVFVNAGADIQTVEAADVVLSGQASGDTTSMTWSWTSSPAATITHSDNTVADAVFTAPAVTTDTTYVLTLTGTNSSGNSDTDTINILVKPVNIAPDAVINPSQQTGQPANTYSAGAAIILSGSASTDSDAPDAANPISVWEWQQTAGDSVLNNVQTDEATLSVFAPVEANGQTLSFTLTVTDAEGATDTASVTLTVLSESQTEPTADAGNDQAVFSGERVLLIGSADTTVSAGLPLTVEWDGPANASALIANPVALSTYAIAPLVTTETVVNYSFAVTDSFGHVVFDELAVTVRPLPTPLMNDTGVTVQANNTAYANTQQNDFPGQDGQRGSDVVNNAGFLQKAGRGEAGFDFTKLNSNGDEQDDTSQSWSCVRDNITGLVWETKTTDGGLRDADNTYSWYFTDENGGYVGIQVGSAAVCTLTRCNTEAYVTALNAAGLCGFYDWRLPTHEELMSVVHFGKASGVLLDTDYFPNSGTTTATDTNLWYWTRIPSADGVSGDTAQNAWAIDFTSGLDNFLYKGTDARVRLVRAGR